MGYQRVIFLTMMILVLSMGSLRTEAIVTEISGNFSYDRQVFGENKQNKKVEKTYDTALAFYLFRLTGIEFNYAYENDVTTENDRLDVGNGMFITKKVSTINTRIYGIGIRQAFAAPRSLVVPHIAIGYGYQIKSGGVDYTLDDNGQTIIYHFPYPQIKSEPVFAVFTLQFYLTRAFSIQGSVKTVFEAFRWSEAKDSIKYTAGMSWMF